MRSSADAVPDRDIREQFCALRRRPGLFRAARHYSAVSPGTTIEIDAGGRNLMTDKKRDAEPLDLESPLGLADEPIVTTASDHVENSSDPSLRRRRARALG